MFKKQSNIWEKKKAFIKEAGVWVPSTKVMVKEAGAWVGEKVDDQWPGAYLVLETVNTGAETTCYVQIAPNNAYASTVRIYSTTGTLLRTVTLPSTVNRGGDFYMPMLPGTNIMVFTCQAPGGVLDGNAWIQFWNGPAVNNFFSRILKIDNNLYRRAYPRLFSTRLTAVPPNLPINVRSIASVFESCSAFNDPSVKQWNTADIANFNQAFASAVNFKQDLSAWNTTAATSWSSFATGSGMTVAQVPPKFR